MRKLSTILIGITVTACVAYLSWPAPADFPPSRGKTIRVTPVSNGKPSVVEFEVYKTTDSKAVTQPSV